MPTNFLGAASLKSIEQNLKPNQRYFDRLLIDTSGQASIQRFVP
jgi:G3E family GTPase